ncbi:hypothetical protein FRC10_002550 [Ceratobasidium sp. 414]|nr:hypothetical protein FRC10_002550 [Ceratobasidium sp. 414]
MQAPADQVQRDERIRLRIQSIEVSLETPPKYPINIKLLSNGRLLYNLKAIDKNQLLRWEDINPIDVDQSGLVGLRVYELHWLGKKRERVGAVGFQVREMVNARSSVTARDGSGSPPFSVSVTLAATNSSHSAAENAHNAANASVAISPSLLESMGRTRNAVEIILKIGQQLAEPNPIAKASVGLCTQAWETLKKQDQCDALVAKLVTEMGDVLPHVAAIEDHAKLAKLQDTIKEMLLLVEDASRFIIGYKSNGAAVRAVLAFVSSTAQDQVDEFVGRFSRLKENFDRGIATQVVQRVETLLGDADRAVLKPLIIPGAGYDLSRGCLEGTRMEIINDICNWALAATGSPGLYWLYGPAGCGKSAVSTSVSKSLHSTGALGGSFFCKRDNEHLRKPENVISDLAMSLAHKYPEYGVKLVEALRNDPKLADSPMKTRFVGMIIVPLQSIGQGTQFTTSIVVVDAIDESGTVDSRVELVRCLLEMSQLVNWLRVLVTSRPNEEIHHILASGQGGIKQRDLFSEDEASVSRDIAAYVRSRMNAIPTNTTGRNQWPDEGEIHRLSASSNKLFIWARTACNLIQQSLDPSSTLEQILAGQRSKGAMKALGEIYTTALNEGLGEANDDASLIQSCVGAIVLTGLRRPLPDAALARMLANLIKPHALSRVINRLGSVLYRDGSSAVRVLHQSFSDYMTGDDCPGEYRIDVPMQNAELAASCLRVMLQDLRFNICGLEDSRVMNSDVPDLQSRIEKNISLELSYSCLYWTTHLATPVFTAIPPRTFKLLDKFLLGTQLLYWIEVLSLTKELHVITEGMDQVMEWINTRAQDPQSKYAKIAYDLYRFLWAASEPISSSTPHLYVSALAFGAANYEALKVLKPQFPNTLSVTSGLGLWKSPYLRGIHTNEEIDCLSPSPDGRHIACGFKNRTVRIWDAYTGAALLKPLQGHSDRVNAIAISSGGRRIVSGSADRTVRIWDGHTGAALFEPLKGHSMGVTSVAISSDGRRIVSGSWDETVRVWDGHTGAALFQPLKGHSRSVTCVEISSDGRRIVSGSRDKTVQIWNAHTGAALLEPLTGHSRSVQSVAISSDGQRIVSGSGDETVRLWDAHTGAALLKLLHVHQGWNVSVAISANGRHIVSGSSSKAVCIWDAHTGAALLNSPPSYMHRVCVAISSNSRHIVYGFAGKTVQVRDTHTSAALLMPLQGHSGEVNSVAISSDGRRIVSSSRDKTVRIWDASTGVVLFELLKGHSEGVISVAISPDGQYIVSGSDKTVRVWDGHTGAALFEPMKGHSGGVTSVAISSDGRRIVSGSWDETQIVSGSQDETVRTWDAQTGAALLKPLQGHSGRVNSVAISSDGRRIVSGSWDKTVRIWDAHTGSAPLEPLRGHSGEVTSVSISSDCQYIVSGSDDKTVRIWDAHTGAALLEPLQGHSWRVTLVAISSDCQYIVSGSDDKTVRIWDGHNGVALLEPLQGHSRLVGPVTEGQHVISGSKGETAGIWEAHSGAALSKLLKSHPKGVMSVAISSDGQYIVSGSSDRTVRIWDRHTGAALFESLKGHSMGVTSVAISSDGRRIVSGSWDETVRVWDGHTGAALLEPLKGHSNSVQSVAISPDGQRIASGSSDKTVRIWDAHTGAALLEPLKGHLREVASVAISSDGRRIVSGSWDKTVRIWDAHTGAALLEPLKGHSEWVSSVAISPNGQHVASGSADRTLRIWDAHTGTTLLEPLRGHSDKVTSVAISPNSRYIVSGSSDNTVRVWDMQSGVAYFEPLLICERSVASIAISPDGQRIVLSGGPAVLVWDFPDGLSPFTFQEIFQNLARFDSTPLC